MGLAGLSAGPELRAKENWVGPPGSAQFDRKYYFFDILSSAKIYPEISR
jgi:hypothetical protein